MPPPGGPGAALPAGAVVRRPARGLRLPSAESIARLASRPCPISTGWSGRGPVRASVGERQTTAARLAPDAGGLSRCRRGRPRSPELRGCRRRRCAARATWAPVGLGGPALAPAVARPGAVAGGRAAGAHRGRRLRARRGPRGGHVGRQAGRLGALEVLAAPGAERPVELDEVLAVGTDAAQPVAAGGADDPVLVDGPRAVGAVRVRGDLGQHGLLGERPLVDLGDGLLGSHDAVEQQAEEEEDGREDDDGGRRDVGREGARRAQAHVAVGPEGAGQPDEDDVGHEDADAHLEDVALDETGERGVDFREQVLEHGQVASVVRREMRRRPGRPRRAECSSGPSSRPGCSSGSPRSAAWSAEAAWGAGDVDGVAEGAHELAGQLRSSRIVLARTGSQRTATRMSSGRRQGCASSSAGGMRSRMSWRPSSWSSRPMSALESVGPMTCSGGPGGGPGERRHGAAPRRRPRRPRPTASSATSRRP